jgi:ABC-2 type transport system permease protein
MSLADTLEAPMTVSSPALARPGFDIRALWTLYTLTLRQHMRGKRWIVMALLFLVPAALAIVVRATAPDAPPIFIEFVFAFMFIPQALLPLVALLYASGVIQDELEEQTITYLLIRPIPRWALYVVKMLATITTTVVLTILFTTLTYIAVHFRGPHQDHVVLRCVQACAIHSLAVVAYCCLFGFISLLTKRALVVGILYAAIVEGLLANLPLSIRLITVIYYARVIAYRCMPFIAPVGGNGPEDIANEAWQMGIENDPHLLDHPQISTCVAILLIASLVLTMLAAFLCSQKEFHVKTPEKT